MDGNASYAAKAPFARRTWGRHVSGAQAPRQGEAHEEMRSNRCRSNAHADDSIDLDIVRVDAVRDVEVGAIFEDVGEQSKSRCRKDDLHRRQKENLS